MSNEEKAEENNRKVRDDLYYIVSEVQRLKHISHLSKIEVIP